MSLYTNSRPNTVLIYLHPRATNLHENAGWFIIFAGVSDVVLANGNPINLLELQAILGLCAGLLWTAQGSLMLAYPTGECAGQR